MRIGGEWSVRIGLENREDFEEAMLEENLLAMELDDSFWLKAGEAAMGRVGELLEGGPRTKGQGQLGHILRLAKDMKKARSAAAIGREAHRQILRYKYGKLAHEVPLELEPGVFVRKDALRIRKQGAQVIIIKPNTPTGRAAAQRREQLMRRYGYDTKVEYYDPNNPAYRRGSSTYIGE